MSGLTHDRVDDIEAGNLVFWTALLDELLDTLDDVLVVLDRLDGPLCDSRHFGLGDRRLDLVQRRELQVKRGHLPKAGNGEI